MIAMTHPSQTREDRLAAKLRENLHRRKDQARELGAGRGRAAPGATPEPAGESPDLPKAPPTR